MCPARMPTSPTAVRVTSICSSPENTSPSGVRTWASSVCSGIALGLGLLGLLGLLALLALLCLGLLALDALVLLALLLGPGDLVDRALHVEGGLGQVVVLAVEDLAEAAHGVGYLDV